LLFGAGYVLDMLLLGFTYCYKFFSFHPCSTALLRAFTMNSSKFL